VIQHSRTAAKWTLELPSGSVGAPLVQTEMSPQLLDGLPWNLALQPMKSPSASAILCLVPLPTRKCQHTGVVKQEHQHVRITIIVHQTISFSLMPGAHALILVLTCSVFSPLIYTGSGIVSPQQPGEVRANSVLQNRWRGGCSYLRQWGESMASPSRLELLVFPPWFGMRINVLFILRLSIWELSQHCILCFIFPCYALLLETTWKKHKCIHLVQAIVFANHHS